jgi:tetratricopeptide (TPR) repeat protein
LGSEDLLLATQADTEGWYGKLKNAHELTRRAMDSAQHNDAKESAAAYQAAAALREVESGNREQARAEANAALRLAPNRDVRAMAALALARAGDRAGAEKLAAELDKTFPLDTLVQRYWLPAPRRPGEYIQGNARPTRGARSGAARCCALRRTTKRLRGYTRRKTGAFRLAISSSMRHKRWILGLFPGFDWPLLHSKTTSF